MQLGLFDDNRSTILLNIADEFIRSGDLPQALSVYEQMLSDTPGDQTVASLHDQVGGWLDRLIEINAGPRPELLQSAWACLDTISLPSLRAVVLDTLIEALESLPDAEFVFEPPRFHLGQLLMEARRFDDAADCFLSALQDSGIPQGTLLAWRGDALTLAENTTAALQCYLAAFVEDPFAVDTASIRSRPIRDLLQSLHVEAGDEIDEDEAPAWLPVWGWLDGVFPLEAVSEKPSGAAAYGGLLAEPGCLVPRIWYRMLAFAEGLRRSGCDARELGAVRRLMKGTNGFMFGCYLEKIGGRR